MDKLVIISDLCQGILIIVKLIFSNQNILLLFIVKKEKIINLDFVITQVIIIIFYEKNTKKVDILEIIIFIILYMNQKINSFF